MTTTSLLARAELKAAQTATGTRTLDFYAAAFNVVDSNGDMIDPDAANGWLVNFYAEGNAMPISFAHSAMRDMTDPGRFIGDAPADSSHVWIDNYGVRVKANLYTDADGPMGENARAAARLIDQNVVNGASITYLAEKANVDKSGVRHITQLSIYEAGPCLIPANPDAVILGIKTADGQLLLAEKPASEGSVDATLALIVGSDTIETIETVTKEGEMADPESKSLEDIVAGVLETKHSSSPRYIQAAHDALAKAGAKCAEVEAEVASAEPPTEIPVDDDAERLHRMAMMKAKLVLF